MSVVHNPPNLALIKKRALLKKDLRAFLEQHGILEVDVPCIGKTFCPDPFVEVLPVKYFNQQFFLQPSPELFLKRALSLLQCDLYSLGPVFRHDSVSPYHNPEFLMLELYLVGPNRFQELIQSTIDITRLFVGNLPVEYCSYRQLFADRLNIDDTSNRNQLIEALNAQKISFSNEFTTRDLEDLLFTVVIQPLLGIDCISVVNNFPLEQAALAKIIDNIPQRFELFYKGTELANGYDELIDRNLNQERFIHWIEHRKQNNQVQTLLDTHFLQSLESLPDCSGVAFGFERAVMLGLGASSLTESMMFTWNSL